MKHGQVMLVIASQLDYRAFLCQAEQALGWFPEPGSKYLHLGLHLKAFRSKHRVCSPTSTSLSQDSVSEEHEHALVCCRTVFWLLVDVNGKGSSL